MSLYRAGVAARVYLGGQLASAVYRGNVLIWRRDPEVRSDSVSFSATAPPHAAFATVGVLGGGGGGATADNGASASAGSGGYPAVWNTVTVPVKPGDVLTFTIGTGGTGASGGPKRSGTAGGASTVTGPGLSLTSAGGAPGVGSTTNDDTTGRGAASVTANGLAFPGGPDVAARAVGSTPGGGGGGGPYPGWFGTAQSGGDGGPGSGRVWWRSF